MLLIERSFVMQIYVNKTSDETFSLSTIAVLTSVEAEDTRIYI